MNQNLDKIKRLAETFTATKPKAQEDEILIYGVILDFDFWGLDGVVTTSSVLKQLKSLEDADEISVRINSPGGYAFEGIAIYNALARHSAKINVWIDALAASAASVVAMAGDSIRMADNSVMMIHKAWSLAIGNSDDMMQEAEILEKVDGNLAATYSARTEQTPEDVMTMMAAETWFNAEEAVEKGFADEIVKSKEKPKASVDIGVYANVPEWAKERFTLEEPPPRPDPEAWRAELDRYKKKSQIISLF